MDELRELHVGLDRGSEARSVLAELTEAYLIELAAAGAAPVEAEPPSRR